MKISELLSSSSTRIKTGIVLILAVLIIGYVDSFFVMWIFLGALLVVALNESMVLFKMKSDLIYAYTGIVWFIAFFYPSPEDLIFLIAVVYASLLAYTKTLDKKLFLPLLYPTASFLFLLTLYIQYGIESLLWLLVVVAGADVGAYFVGKGMGKHKFCETSPNKTWEGVAGGMLVSAALGTYFALDSLSLFGALVVSVLVAFASVFGDLFESYLKREAEVKDSGNILPGHGGILDRTDGYLFGGIVMLILLRVMI